MTFRVARAAPDAQVLVLGYPQFFPTGQDTACLTGLLIIYIARQNIHASLQIFSLDAGATVEGKELVADEREKEIIALARQLSAQGVSSRQIAARVAEEAGHRPKVGEQGSFVQVGRLLRERG